MPRSTCPILVEHGYHAVDVRDIGLRGADDETIYDYAQRNRLTIITEDRGFGNILRFPLKGHQGIIVFRFPNEMPTGLVNSLIIEKIQFLVELDLSKKIIIIDPEKIRIRTADKYFFYY